MKNIGKFALVGVIVMTVLSFANFFGTRIAGAAVIVGVIFFSFIRGGKADLKVIVDWIYES